MSIAWLFAIIIFFSVVQSVIGVGLLVFGTPTLLLLGYGFEETLAIVLPSSICISFLQVYESKGASERYKKNFNFHCLPYVLIGTLIVLLSKANFDFKNFVGFMLIFSGTLRFSKRLSDYFSKIVSKYAKIYLAAMGTIHGLTNMGGGLLTYYSSTVNNNEKEATRTGVAYGYLFMGLIQYITLVAFNRDLVNLNTLFFSVASIITYLVLGKRVFNFTNNKVYNQLITGIIFFYGITLVVA